MAMLRAGMNYAEAAQFAGLPVERVMDLWKAAEKERENKLCRTP